MLYLKPRLLGSVGLDDALLKADKKACVRCGPCGVGEKALYLNSYWLDRRWYIPISNIQRAYKRVAMSKGGFTGKGMFGSYFDIIRSTCADVTTENLFSRASAE